MNIINPKHLKIIKGLPPKASPKDRVALDTEFFGMEKKRLHRPHGQFAYLGCTFDGETVYYITDEADIPDFLKQIEDAVWILANAKFDIRQMRPYAEIPDRTKLWDVILIEQIMYSGLYDSFALDDLVRRYLDTYMPKEVRKEFTDASFLTPERIGYASGDVAYTWKVYKVQREKISDDDLLIWKEIELPFMWTILGMSGVRLDTVKWAALARRNYEEGQAVQSKYGKEEIVIGPRGGKKSVWTGINLNAPAQVKAHFAKIGWPVDDTDKDTLVFLKDDCEFARDMLLYRMYSKRSSTYGENIIEDFVEEDGKIYADLFQIGAETGRTSCRQPNLQNQPHEHEYRECFIADDDEVMIVADWGSQEGKIAAYKSQDERLIAAVNSDEKLYIRIAREVLGREIQKDSPEYKHIKSTVLGIFYGMQAKGLAKRIGVSVVVAQSYIDAFLDTYPGVADYMKTQHQAKDYVETIYGRKIWLNKFNWQWKNNSLNAPIQGSAGDAMKLAANRFMQERKDKTWKLLLLVHDEIVIAAPKDDEEDAKKFLEYCMVSVANEMHEGVRGTVDIFSGSNWGVKH